jgi:2-iminobutanoate/2-iminopropanoate deaminase
VQAFSICKGGNTMENAQAISTTEAPKAIGPYSQGILAGQFLFVSGQLPINPADGKMIDGDIAERAKLVFRNMSAIIDSAGGSIADVVKITLFLTDMGDFQHVNEVYSQHFRSPYPARSAIQVSALPLGSNIEAEATVYIP